jgi:hypothetical protein
MEIKLGTLVLCDLGKSCIKTLWVVVQEPTEVPTSGHFAEFGLRKVWPVPAIGDHIVMVKKNLMAVAENFDHLKLGGNAEHLAILLNLAEILWNERKQAKENATKALEVADELQKVFMSIATATV